MLLTCADWEAARWQDRWNATEAIGSDTLELLISGVPTTFQPLDVVAYRLPQHEEVLDRRAWDAAVVWHDQNRHRWAAAASRGPLSIVVLGTSVTAGCAPPHPCRLDHSWARLLQNFVNWQLRRAAVDGFGVRVDIHAKNAVHGSYYTHCSARRVPPGGGLVMLEVATNLWGTKEKVYSAATALVRAMRRVAPEKVVAFALWPPLIRSAEVVAAIRQAAAAEGADVLDMGRLSRDATGGGLSIRDLYGNRGADKVHPSSLGHTFFAAMAARFVVQGLILGARARCNTGRAPSATEGLTTRLAHAPVGEQCFDSANLLPVAGRSHRTAWQLVDEGTKGVSKLGLLSRRAGETVTLGPLPQLSASQLPPACAMLQLELGYLTSAYARSGRFRISCVGCSCSRIAAPYQSAQYPFPLVETDAQLSLDGSVRLANASVTVTTKFHALAQAGQDCYLNITNVPRVDRLNNRSRVRIDSLMVAKGGVVQMAYMHTRGFRRHGEDGRATFTPAQLVERAASCSPDLQVCRGVTGSINGSSEGGWAKKYTEKLCTALRTKHLS